MMYLPYVTEWFFIRRPDGFYDVIVDGLVATCPAFDVGIAFYVLVGDDYDPYDED